MAKRKTKKQIVWLSLFILLILAAWLAVDTVRTALRPPPRFERQIVVIPPGASVIQIGKILESRGVISQRRYFRWYYQVFFRDRTLKSGEYLFDRPLSLKEVIEKLASGRVLLQKFTIKEGLTYQEIARLLDQNRLVPYSDFVAAARDASLVREIDGEAKDLEGYLFPDTYMLEKSISGEEMVELMVVNFRRHFVQPMVWRCEGELRFSIRQVVTLASLIEKETADPTERFRISSVFHNRFKRRMNLDCDPTIVYALERDGRYFGKLGWDELKYDSPYNTRLHRGLPPGPICNPGIASIRAALYPEETNFLYFVSKDGHQHYFSETLEEHNQAVRRFIINRDAPISR